MSPGARASGSGANDATGLPQSACRRGGRGRWSPALGGGRSVERSESSSPAASAATSDRDRRARPDDALRSTAAAPHRYSRSRSDDAPPRQHRGRHARRARISHAAGTSGAAASSRSSARSARLGWRAPGPTPRRTRRTPRWPSRSRWPRRRPVVLPAVVERAHLARAAARYGANARRGPVSALVEVRLRRGRRPTPALRRGAVNRSSNACARSRGRSASSASALLASKPSMRAVASATVCRYGPSRASSA